MTTPLDTVRRSTQPLADDTWQALAARFFPGSAEDEAVANLQAWNLHLFMRPAAPAGSPRAGNPILPSDVVFLEPPAQ